MEELGLLFAGEALSSATNRIKKRLNDRGKRRRMAKLLDETATRAAMTRSAVDLEARFKNVHLVEELFAHLELIDRPRSEAIATFLGEDADEDAIKFVERFCDCVDEIMATADESLTDRKTLEVVEATREMVEGLQASNREERADNRAQIALLEKTVPQIEAGEIEAEELPTLANKARNSLAGSYLRAYHALCVGDEVDFSALEKLRDHNGLALSLASLAVSARQTDAAEGALRLCAFDATSIATAVRTLKEDARATELPMKVTCPDAEKAAGIVGLLNFEHYFCMNAFSAAEECAAEGDFTWNPIARAELRASRLMTASMLNDPKLPEVLAETINGYRSWFPKRLDDVYRASMSSALSRLSPERAAKSIGMMPEALREFSEDEGKKLELRVCTDPAKAKEIAVWAEAKRDPGLLITSTAKVVELDKSWRPEAIELFNRCGDWAFPSSGALDLYVSLIEPNISPDKLFHYGRGMEGQPTFHLIAYKTLSTDDPEAANEHIERAISLMRSPTSAPDLINSDIWAPYLIENGRSDELKELVASILPYAPYEYIMALLSAVSRLPGTDSLLDDLITSAVGSEFSDARTAEVAARHLSASGQEGLAGRVALAVFKKSPNETLAEIAAQWMLDSSLEIDEGIVRYATEADTARMNILLAAFAKESGMTQEQNARLIRAALEGGDAGGRALSLYALWNIGQGQESGNPETVKPDSYATFVIEDGSEETILFLSDLSSIRSEGACCQAGIAFSTRSKEFLSCRGLRVGDSVDIGGGQKHLTEIGWTKTLLIRKGLELAVQCGSAIAITGTPEDAVQKIGEFLKGSAPRIDMYRDGIETDRGTLYPGIETGSAIIGPSRRLEFLIETISNPELPYRKHPLSVNVSPTPDCRFLLSCNAVVVLALLNIPDDALASIRKNCLVTESTARRLSKNAAEFAEEPYSSSGRLGHDGERLVLREFDDGARRQFSETGAAILSLLDSMEKISPSLDNVSVELEQALDENTVIDIKTASAHDLVYVTEDVMEALVVDSLNSIGRCSLSAMLMVTDCLEYLLRVYLAKMKEWGAEPVLELDLAEFLWHTLTTTDVDDR